MYVVTVSVLSRSSERTIRSFNLAVAHQNYNFQAMQTLMYAVATPIPGQASRTSCVYFRLRTTEDQHYIRITYGEGCSGTVGVAESRHAEDLDRFCSPFRLDTGPVLTWL